MSDTAGLVFKENADGGLDFIGDFENLYQLYPNPWGQNAEEGRETSRYYLHSRARLASAVSGHFWEGRITGLEVGCGQGHVISYLKRMIYPSYWEGMDISPTAVLQAAQLLPGSNFFVDDIARAGIKERRPALLYNVVVLGQVLWYILHKMDDAVRNCHELLAPNGLLIISQAFLEEQRYGKEIADGFQGLLWLFLDMYSHRFRVIEASYDDSGHYLHPDGLLVLRRVD